MRIIDTEAKPIKMWLDDIEDGALAQAKNLANLPFTFSHVALMPDTHQGYGMPIGAVLATKDVIIPNAVGVDIGCGMCAVKTSIQDINTDTLKQIMRYIRNTVPVGFARHKSKQAVEVLPSSARTEIVERELENALTQVGTLGGGNHFIELQKGSDGFVWIMIHSGSRNLGLKVASHYNQKAQLLNAKWPNTVPAAYDLAFLPLEEQDAQAYISDMQYCVDFALANRKLMMDRIMEGINQFAPAQFEPMINIPHNYATLEPHFGQDVLVHRKGATKATADVVGIIPGSQGTKSYIVKGKGNPESFHSSSHGAGRKLSRKQAQQTLQLEQEIQKLNELGVIHAIRGISDLDEAPGSYKDISVVMRNQEDLVDILVELTPLAVIKG